MASGQHRAFRGSYVGTGANLDVTIIGFRPKGVELYSSAGDSGYWSDDFADASVYKRNAAGAGSLATSNGITPLANGFRIGTDTDLNVSGERVHYVVWG